MTEYKLKQLDEDISYIKHELFIIKKWKDEKIYQQVIQKNKGREIFRFIDGPPFISSDVLHLGHLLVSSVKVNFKNMFETIGKYFKQKSKITFGLNIQPDYPLLIKIEENSGTTHLFIVAGIKMEES